MSLRTVVAALWLTGTLGAGLLALSHFWRLGRPAPTATIIAVSAAGSFFFFLWPRVRGFVPAPSVFLVVMLVALALALAALLLPVLVRVKVRPQ